MAGAVGLLASDLSVGCLIVAVAGLLASDPSAGSAMVTVSPDMSLIVAEAVAVFALASAVPAALAGLMLLPGLLVAQMHTSNP